MDNFLAQVLGKFWGDFGEATGPGVRGELFSQKPRMVRWASADWHFFAVFGEDWTVFAGFGPALLRACHPGHAYPFFPAIFSRRWHVVCSGCFHRRDAESAEEGRGEMTKSKTRMTIE